jgi:hypothetical protein
VVKIKEKYFLFYILSINVGKFFVNRGVQKPKEGSKSPKREVKPKEGSKSPKREAKAQRGK